MCNTVSELEATEKNEKKEKTADWEILPLWRWPKARGRTLLDWFLTWRYYVRLCKSAKAARGSDRGR